MPYAQTMKAFIAAADNSFMQKDYYSALIYYLDALEFDSTRTDLQYRTAEAARLFNAYTLAEEKYQIVVDDDSDAEFPLSSFWLANMKQKTGQYEEAKRYYELYLSENRGDEAYYTDRADMEVEACDWAIDQIQNPDESVTIDHLGDGINTGYSEFGALSREGDLYFSSKRYTEKGKIHVPDRVISKILKSEDEVTAEVVDQVNKDDLHTAHTTFSKDGLKMYYTVCKYIYASEIRCDIYYRPVLTDSTFGAEVKLPDQINSTTFTSTQPNIGLDPETGQERLYFVSDREGGKGKLDLWYSDISANGDYSEPVNLMELNTIEDEISPFYHEGSKSLFFSSEGYQSLGGFDIFKSEFGETEFLDPKHLRYPVNSSFHDIYYTISDDQLNAHFSSNREDSYYLDNEYEACCYDIYKAEYEEIIINLLALTFDKFSMAPLSGATVKLFDIDRGIIIEEKTNLDSNDFQFVLERDKNYLIIGEKSPFESDTVSLSTEKIFKSTDIVKKLFLGLDSLELEVLTFDKKTLESLNGATVTLINMTDNNVRDVIQINELSNDFHFTLERGKVYRIIASKPGYITETIELDTSGDPEGGKITREIYLGRKDLNIYLPLALYYDNDRPDQRTYRRTTRSTYTQTYNPYIRKKETFKREYTRDLSGESKIISEQNIDDFFEFNVRGGYEKLNSFMDALLRTLQKGQKLNLSIRGFASPRAASYYNLALGQRRIQSVRNELQKYQNGVLMPFIDNGQLVITDISYGETLAPSGISDDFNDERNSIYSVEASRERRVEIIQIDTLND